MGGATNDVQFLTASSESHTMLNFLAGDASEALSNMGGANNDSLRSEKAEALRSEEALVDPDRAQGLAAEAAMAATRVR
eukprot:4598389-Karenia_brevis.AAC.1